MGGAGAPTAYFCPFFPFPRRTIELFFPPPGCTLAGGFTAGFAGGATLCCAGGPSVATTGGVPPGGSPGGGTFGELAGVEHGDDFFGVIFRPTI